jgi:hypothetical protein
MLPKPQVHIRVYVNENTIAYWLSDEPQVLYRIIPDSEMKDWKERTVDRADIGLDWRYQ